MGEVSKRALWSAFVVAIAAVTAVRCLFGHKPENSEILGWVLATFVWVVVTRMDVAKGT